MDNVGCGGCASVRECARGREVLGWSRPVGTAENEDERPTWRQSQREQNIQAGCIRLERRHRSQKARLQTWAAPHPPEALMQVGLNPRLGRSLQPLLQLLDRLLARGAVRGEDLGARLLALQALTGSTTEPI